MRGLCAMWALVFAVLLLGADRFSALNLPLEKPSFEWIQCTCPNGAKLGLKGPDFVKHQMWVAGLKNEAELCIAKE